MTLVCACAGDGMKAEFVRQLMEMSDDVWIKTLGQLVLGREFHPGSERKMLEKMWKASEIRKRADAVFRKLPDKEFETQAAQIATLPAILRQVLSTNLVHLPAKRGGRPAAFSLELRRAAINDLGDEHKTKSFSDAVEAVAAKHGMSADYVRKIWKNRKRLQK